jgi:HEPN domain-containing protein
MNKLVEMVILQMDTLIAEFEEKYIKIKKNGMYNPYYTYERKGKHGENDAEEVVEMATRIAQMVKRFSGSDSVYNHRVDSILEMN